MISKHKTILFSATALVSFFAGTLPVYADAVLTFDRETTGSMRPQRQPRPDENGNDAPQPPAPTSTATPKQTVTVFMKGVNARVEFRPMGVKPETAPTTVLLYDGTAQKVYTINPAAQTYFTQTYKEAIDGEPKRNAEQGMASRIAFKGTVDLKAARANNAFVSKEVAGASARQYLVSGNLAMQFNMPQGTGGSPVANGNGFPRGGGQGAVVTGGGGFPGGYSRGDVTVQADGTGTFGGRRRGPGGQNGPAGGGFTPPSIAVEGSIWSTDGVALFTEGRETPMAAVYRLMLPDDATMFSSSLVKPLFTRLKNMKSLPGESTVAFRMTTNFRNGGGGEAPTEAPLSTHLSIREIKTDATLDDTLFAVPTGFKEAEQPAPDFGGRGQGRGQQGRFRGNRGQ